MMSISPGIIRVAMKREKTRSLPGNLSREKAKADSTEVMSTPTVVKTVMMMVLIRYRPKGAAVQAST